MLYSIQILNHFVRSLTKPGSDCSGRIPERIPDRTPDRIGSDWYLRFWCRIIILRKAVLTMTEVGWSKKSEFSQHKSNRFDLDFYFRAACVTDKKKILSHVSPGLNSPLA